MQTNLFFCLVSVLFVCTVARGDEKTFERRYNEVYSDIIASNVDEAHRIADSLYQNSENDLQRIKSLMLLANIKHSIGDISSSLLYVLRAQKIAEMDGLPEWEARTSGFLASTFRHVGLYSESKKHLRKADIANEKQQKAAGYPATKINILQEYAFHELENDRYHAALEFLDGAKLYIEQDTATNPRAVLVRATNDQLIGICYLHLNKLSLADSLFTQSLNLLGGQESNLRPYIYRGLAEVELKRKNLPLAEEYLEKAEPYIMSSNREELKRLLYESYAKLYRDLDPQKADYYKGLHRDLLEDKLMMSQKIADRLLENRAIQQSNFQKIATAAWLVLACIVISFIVYVVRRYKRREKLILVSDPSNQIKRTGVTVTYSDSEMNMAEDTEERLLLALEDLEKKQFYLQTDISLTKLSSMMYSNARYISYIFRKYRGKDFNAYLQTERIAYLIERLQEDETLLDCKISYLASLCGFATHSKFLSAFRAETSSLPSDYIQRLRIRRDNPVS